MSGGREGKHLGGAAFKKTAGVAAQAEGQEGRKDPVKKVKKRKEKRVTKKEDTCR